MKHVPELVFIVTALLQLCCTEIVITHSLPDQWYSNIVNDDGYSPRPISEIFTTQTPFSTTNPIVILPSSTSQSQGPSDQGASTLTQPQQTTWQTTPTTSRPSETTWQTSQATSSPVEVIWQTSQSTTLPPSDSTMQSQTASPVTTPMPQMVSQPFQPPPPIPVANPEQIQFQIPMQPFQASVQRDPNQQPPNFIYIYQNAPQSIQRFPDGTATAPQNGSFSITLVNPATVPSSIPTTPQIRVPSPVVNISTLPPSSLPPFSTFRNTIFSTFPPTISSQRNPRIINAPIVNRPSNLVRTNVTQPGFYPLLNIRMIAPRGSITNVRINPSSTTVRPITTATRRVSFQDRQNFDKCVNACKNRKEPICATPTSVTPININRLKGFASICHMACHNTFQAEAYVKVVDGRCGKLRKQNRKSATKKLSRNELNRSQYYIIDEDNLNTFVDVTAIRGQL